MKIAKYILVIALLFLILPVFANNEPKFTYVKQNLEIFNLFNFDELKELSKSDHPKKTLQNKINYALNNAAIDNSINNNYDYKFKNDTKIGNYIRIASWNIDRGFNLKQIKQIFNDSDTIFLKIKNPNSEVLKKAKEEREILKNSDIIILNEVDVGMPRTGYTNVIKELATTLKYNYTYGVEFLEVDPVHLGLEDYQWSEERFLYPNVEKIKIDENKYKGLHGSAILSKFPLKNVRIIRLPDTYDWFHGETKRISDLEYLKRSAANVIFKEEMIREIRIGGRIAIIADVYPPNTGTPITIVATHLENRTIPQNRQKQMLTLFKNILSISNPVVLAGDFNTMCRDGSPTGIRKEIKKKLKDPEFIARSAISIAIPSAFVINTVVNATDIARTFTNPTVRSIPIFAPNKERELFKILKSSQFEDGNYFDFRGIPSKTSNNKGRSLSNSNERALKGFEPTYIFERPLLLGKYKLDWFFVKAYLNNQNDKEGSYKLAPHYGRTLFELNYIFDKPISDHTPITVDLPINEPKSFLNKKK
ncbi:MAG: endonuclease/exonuclease/phosphatase family protein [Candidatus Gastranaerophilales bacterium]|nr:endonuclease/exonuclease/phosphatase family protein [Candidatus Gastranaerophilales bacterium]